MPAPYAQFDDAAQRLRWYRLAPSDPLPSPADVQAAARAQGFDLPDDYLDFCARYGAGAYDLRALLPLPAGCALGEAVWLDIVFGIDGPNPAHPEWDALASWRDTYAGRLPEHLLPVGNSPGGDLLLLGVGPRAGVWVWDHEHRELGPDDFAQRTAELAARGVDTAGLDADRLLLAWELRHPTRVANPSGHGNLHRVADGFAKAIGSLMSGPTCCSAKP